MITSIPFDKAIWVLKEVGHKCHTRLEKRSKKKVLFDNLRQTA
jgi:hypothetical protein